MYFTFVSFVQLTDSSLFIYQLSVFFLIIHPSFISLHSSVFIHQSSFISFHSSFFVHQSSFISPVFIHQFSFIILRSSVFILQSSRWNFSLESPFSQVMCVSFPQGPKQPFSFQHSSKCFSRREVECWQDNACHENAHYQKDMVNHSALFL